MIERINLIEKEALQITYGRLVMGFGTAILFCALVFGYQTLRIVLLQRSIQKQEEMIQTAKSNRDRLMKVAPPKLGSGPQAELKQIFLDTPRWSLLIQDIAQRMPGNVWLTSLKGKANRPAPIAEGAGGKRPDPKDNKEKDKEPAARGLILSGTAAQAEGMSMFINKLQESPYVKNVVLTNSKKDDKGYSFVVECDTSIPVALIKP